MSAERIDDCEFFLQSRVFVAKIVECVIEIFCKAINQNLEILPGHTDRFEFCTKRALHSTGDRRTRVGDFSRQFLPIILDQIRHFDKQVFLGREIVEPIVGHAEKANHLQARLHTSRPADDLHGDGKSEIALVCVLHVAGGPSDPHPHGSRVGRECSGLLHCLEGDITRWAHQEWGLHLCHLTTAVMTAGVPNSSTDCAHVNVGRDSALHSLAWTPAFGQCCFVGGNAFVIPRLGKQIDGEPSSSPARKSLGMYVAPSRICINDAVTHSWPQAAQKISRNAGTSSAAHSVPVMPPLAER